MDKIFRMNGTKLLVIILDCMLLALSYILMVKLSSPLQEPVIVEYDLIMQSAPWIGAMMLTAYWLFDVYNLSGRREYAKSIYNLMICHIMIGIGLLVVEQFYPLTGLSVLYVISVLGLQCIFVFGLRSLIFWIQLKAIGKKKVMIIADDAETARTILSRIMSNGKEWFEVKGIILASQWNIDLIEAHTTDIDLVILSHDIAPDIKSEVLRFVGSKRIEVLVVPELYELFLLDSEVQFIDDLLVYSILPPHMSTIEKWLKRAIDVIISLVLLVITSPIMLLMVLMIPATSQGRALFTQERIGQDGKPFMVLKFRTMVDNAEENTGPVLASVHDQRITRLGSFIRSTRIDELPQLFNVLKGDMSVVGPRPERAFFIQEFTKQIPYYTYRLMVKPGLTGLAQVKGKYTTSSSDKLRYDLTYIKNYSPMLDVMIILQTIFVVLQREQSKGVSATEPVTDNILFLAKQEVATTAKQGGVIPSSIQGGTIPSSIQGGQLPSFPILTERLR